MRIAARCCFTIGAEPPWGRRSPAGLASPAPGPGRGAPRGTRRGSRPPAREPSELGVEPTERGCSLESARPR